MQYLTGIKHLLADCEFDWISYNMLEGKKPSDSVEVKRFAQGR